MNKLLLMRSKQILLAFFLTISNFMFAGWVNQNTSIADNLQDVSFWGSNGMLAGKKGIYYTTTGGSGAGSWTRFTISSSPGDAAIYDATQFYALASNTTNQAYFCGKDTVNNRAVIFFFNLSTLSYSISYLGSPGSSLNSIVFNAAGNVLYAVGDNGLVIRSNLSTFLPNALGTSQNLNSVMVNGAVILIGGNGVLINCGDSGTSLFGTVYNHPGSDFKSVYYYFSGGIYGVGATVYKFASAGATFSTMNYFDPAPLNGKDIFYTTSGYYIATDHGIYKTDFGLNYAEYQITSGNVSFNNVWFLSSSSTTGYAVGDNGLLMKTTDAGVPMKPFAGMNLNIACKGSFSNLSGISGSATNCNWFLDGGPFGTTCGSIANVFNTVGTYTLSYVVWNASGIYDTATQIITIVDPPIVNMPTSLVDSLLCKKEPALIDIDFTQNDFNYQLKRFGSGLTFGSVPGNGATASMVSDSLTQGLNYYINVQSSLSQCAKAFTDTIKIIVEQTTADYKSSYINSAVGEKVHFYEMTKDANNFKWNFPAGTNISQSFLPNPDSIKFTIPGSTDVQLICWSNNGCYDSITKPATMVYVEPSPADTCWAQAIDGVDPTYPSSYRTGIMHSTPTSNGYLMSGRTNFDIYTSRYGNTYGRTTSHGGVLLKYSPNGILKWFVGNKDLVYAAGWYIEPVIRSSHSDEEGNIFLVGNAYGTNSYLYTNEGDSVKASVPVNPIGASAIIDGYMAKLDSMGAKLWHLSMVNTTPELIKTDHSGNIYITGHYNGYGPAWLDNGVDSTMIPNSSDDDYFLMKLDPLGNLLWSSLIELNHVNSVAISEFGIDQNNSVYMTGYFENTSYFRSASSPAVITMAGTTGTSKFFVVKYDSLGTVTWGMKGRTDASVGFVDAGGYGIKTDDLGYSYVGATNQVTGAGFSTKYFEITDALGTVTDYNVGTMCIMKITPSGTVVWVTGLEKGPGSAARPVITLRGNTLSVISSMSSTTMWGDGTGTLASTDASTFFVTNRYKDYFIADYDTAGVLKRVIGTGNTNVYSGSMPVSMFRDTQGMYYIVGQVSMNTSAPSFDFFTETLTPNGYYESFIAKMGLYPCDPGIITGEEILSHSEGEVFIYPNPVSDEFNIDLRKVTDAKVNIFNSLGQLVFKKEVHGQQIKIKKQDFAMSTGIYFVEVLLEGNRIVKNIAVE